MLTLLRVVSPMSSLLANAVESQYSRGVYFTCCRSRKSYKMVLVIYALWDSFDWNISFTYQFPSCV